MSGSAGRRDVVYRALLRMLPAWFRERHGGAMAATFAEARAAAVRKGARSVAKLYAREVADVAATAVRLRVGTRPWRSSLAAGKPSRQRLVWVLRDDVQLALRAVRRNAAFFWFAALTLGTGVGATTAMYSALRSVVLEPLPFPGGARVVSVWRTMGRGSRVTPTADQVAMLRSERGIFDRFATYSASTSTVTEPGAAAELGTVRMDAELPAFMGIEPVVGRVFGPDELAGEGARVALISERLWRGRFGGRADVLGRTVTIEGEPHTVIGVMPRGAVRPDGMPLPIDVWLPLGDASAGRSPLARLVAGVTHEIASERVDALFRDGAEAGFGGIVTPVTIFRYRGLAEPLRVLMAAVSLLLLIACVNVANLLLHRGVTRARETAVRAALGASRWRIARQFVLESVVLACAGAAIGAALGWMAVLLVRRLHPAELIALGGVRIDGTVLSFSLAVSIAAGLLFGLVPAIRAARVNATSALPRTSRSTATGSARFRWSLVGVEVALSFALLTAASVLIGNVRDDARRDTGYEPASFVAVSVRLPSWRYEEEAARRAVFDRIVAEYERLPGVEQVALASGVPPRFGIMFGKVHVDGHAEDTETTVFHGGDIDAAFLPVIGQTLVRGRTFDANELRHGNGAVILGESAAARLFGDGEAVGRRFRLANEDYRVVGVARDIPIVGLGESAARPIAYFPLATVGTRMMLVLRAPKQDAVLLTALRAIVGGVERDALVDVDRGADLLGDTLARQRFTALLLTIFAAVAVVLSAVGLYGVIAQVVTSRGHEIGVRVALGADASSIRTLVLRSGGLVVGLGLLAGLALSFGALRLLGASMFGLGQHRPGAYSVAALVLGGVSLLAMWRPAARAARLDPMRVLHND